MRPTDDQRRSLLLIIVVAALVLGALVLVSEFRSLFTDPDRLAAAIRGFGPWAPVAFVLLQAVQVVVAPIPGQVTGLVSGYLFGAVAGTVYSALGLAIGSAVALSLARRFGRPYVERAVDPATLERFDRAADRDGLLAFFLAFLVPGFPDDAICFVGGVTRIPLWELFAVAVVGRLPTVFLVNLVGARIADRAFVDAALLGTFLAALSIVVYVRREAVLDLVRRG